MALERALLQSARDHLRPNKAIILFGPRRVGKTTLMKRLYAEHKESAIILNGEDKDTHNLLEERTVANYRRLIGDKKFLFIDEAQDVPEIGKKLKLMLDEIEGLHIMASGSSAFDLSNRAGEPLVGRAKTLMMYPLCQLEYNTSEHLIQTKGNLPERLILGSYPELLSMSSWKEKQDYLKELVNGYLVKDLLAFDGINKSDKVLSLLKKIAFRVGSEISVEALGMELRISKNTVDRYLDLLSKVFVIFKVGGYNKNLDNEMTKKAKWYFVDNGVRNALIGNFNLLNMRDDIGKLWENYLITERIKKLSYQESLPAYYFWRTHTKQEIDWLEEGDGQLSAFEFKWAPKGKFKIPSLWAKHYTEATFTGIDQTNYLDFIA